MTHKLMAQDPTKQLNDSKLLSSPLMGGALLLTHKRKLEEDSFAVDPSFYHQA